MGKTAFIFSGQGAQYTGMGRQIAEEFKSASLIFDQASDSLGYDVRKMIFEGDDETLKITENTQPAIVTVSIACLQPVLEKGIVPDYVAGLSLGEYSAHVAAGTMQFKDAVSLVRKRGKYMQEAVPLGVGTMAAILGLGAADVVECCNEASGNGVVEPANFNCPGQIVVAGEVKAVEKVVEICKEKGARRAMLLPVSAPFHCSLLKPAGEKIAAELEKLELDEIKIPVVANVTAQIVTDVTQVKDLLIRQVSSPVLWEDSINTMVKNGVDTFVEIGPGKVLSGFVKKVDRSLRTFNIEDMDSLNKTLEGINEVKS